MPMRPDREKPLREKLTVRDRRTDVHTASVKNYLVGPDRPVEDLEVHVLRGLEYRHPADALVEIGEIGYNAIRRPSDIVIDQHHPLVFPVQHTKNLQCAWNPESSVHQN